MSTLLYALGRWSYRRSWRVLIAWLLLLGVAALRARRSAAFARVSLVMLTLVVLVGLLAALAAGDPDALAPTGRNDLAEPALDLRPDLAATLATGVELGALGGLLSGSGPTCAFLAADRAHAKQLAQALRERGTGRDVHVVRAPASIGFDHAGRG